MPGMITQQPNGKYCRVSTIVEAPTHTNMSESELMEYLKDTNQIDYSGQTVVEWVNRWGKSWSEAIKAITTLNMTEVEIEEWLKGAGE